MFKSIFHNLILVKYNTIAELKAENSRNYIGYLWWVLEPLLTLVIYYIAFNYIIKNERSLASLYIGIVAYRWFASAIQRSSSSILGNNLMSLVYVHKSIFPLVIAFVDMIKFSVSLLLCIVILLFLGYHIDLSWCGIFLLVFLELLLITGLSLISAAITPFIPDFSLILATILQLTLFLSCVFFDLSDLTLKVQNLVKLNPLAIIIDQYRQVLMYNKMLDFKLLSYPFIFAIVVNIVGWLIIHKFNRKYPKIS